MQGQINLNSLAGKEIIKIVNRPDVLNIVESGTWNGAGSTLCVLTFLRNNQQFYSIELYDDMYNQARLNLNLYINKPNFHLLKGSLIEYEDVFWFDHDSLDFNNDGHAKLWFKKDLEYLKRAKNLINAMPEKIDFLILDGGEYSTYPEWEKLKDRTKIVFLDDTKMLKTNKIRQEIIESNLYNAIIDKPNDRNGFAIFEKK